jgi:DNA-binding NarL/FixJ family response regulator
LTTPAVLITVEDDVVEYVPAPLRVLVVDDHRVFAEALVLALSVEANLEVVGMAHSVTTGIALAQELVPDLVVMDVRLGDGDGVAATAELTRQFPAMSVVVLTGFVDAGLMQRVSDAGASALLPKDGELTEMLQALRTARRGRFIVHPTLLKILVRRDAPRTSDVPDLVGQEPEVLQLLAAGFDATAIARELGMTVCATRDFVQSLLTKLGARSHLDAVVIAMRNGLLHDASLD